MKLIRQLILSLIIAYHRLTKKNLNIGSNVFVHPTASLITRDGQITFGNTCQIQKGVIINTYGGIIEAGNNVSINPYCVIYGHGGVKIGNNVRIATHTVIIPASHNFEDTETPIRQQGLSQNGIIIEDDVWIGAGAKILDGVTISKGCVIAAGAVINKSTEPYCIYGGVPAKKIKKR